MTYNSISLTRAEIKEKKHEMHVKKCGKFIIAE